MDEGLLDTNVFIRALSNDAFGVECRAFLTMVEQGEVTAYLDVLVIHELTYVLPRYLRQMSRSDVVAYLLEVLRWPGIVADKPMLRVALDRWDGMSGLGFVDAYLAARAKRDDLLVYTKNVRELRAQGATVPDPLPYRGQS